jgi:putative FmdB family regulatory protein
MPTYVYKCQDCGHRFEEVQGFHDDPLQVCPDCGGNVRRVIGNVGVTFKGSGFYRTDSRAGAGKKTASDPAKPAAKDSGSSSSGASGGSESSGKSGGSGSTGSSGKSGGSGSS